MNYCVLLLLLHNRLKLTICFCVVYNVLLHRKWLSIQTVFNREKMAQAYDFALDKIGMEIMSYQVRDLSVHIDPNLFYSIIDLNSTFLFFSLDLGGLYKFSQRSVSTCVVK